METPAPQLLQPKERETATPARTAKRRCSPPNSSTWHSKNTNAFNNALRADINDKDPYDVQIERFMTERKNKKGHGTGVRHWLPFRELRGRPEMMTSDTPEENSHELKRFIYYFMMYAPNVNKWATVRQYLTHVKNFHRSKIMLSATPFHWPTVESSLPLRTISTIAQNWFKETDQPSGGRLPMTLGVLELLKPHLDMSNPRHKMTWEIFLLGRMAGIRTGEILALTKDPRKRNTKKDFRATDVLFNKNSTLLSVLGKTSKQKELVMIPHNEVDEIVSEFGQEYDIIKMLKMRVEAESAHSVLLYHHDDGSAFTYQDFMGVLSETCVNAKLPLGRFGGHSGRIALATVLKARGMEDSEIKKRGRWRSDTFEIYIRQLSLPDSTHRVISFKIADLVLDLRGQGFPDIDEFRR